MSDLAEDLCRAVVAEAFNALTLRDLLALAATENDICRESTPDCLTGSGPRMTREQARYAYADRMLKARAGKAKGRP